MMRSLFVVPLAVMVSACSVSDEARVRTAGQTPLEAALSQPAAWAQAPGPASAVVTLPAGAGDVAHVRERSYANGFGQEITLRGGSAAKGANRVEITVADPTRSGRDLAPMAKPSEAGIKAEIAARFPGLAMQVVTRPRRNAYGPYGLAVGRQAGGARCIYAWQWIEDARAASAEGTRPQGMSSLAGQAAPASVRVRMCRSDATLDQMAAHIDQMTVDLTRRSAAPEALEGVAKVPMGSRAASQAQAKRESPEVRGTSAQPVARRTPSRAPDGGSPQPVAVGPAGSTLWRTDGRRYLAPVQESGNTGAAAWARIGRPPGDARQPGSADAAAGSAGARSTAAVPSPNSAAEPSALAASKRGKSLDSSLPMRAYLGPGSSGRAKVIASTAEPANSSPARTDPR